MKKKKPKLIIDTVDLVGQVVVFSLSNPSNRKLDIRSIYLSEVKNENKHNVTDPIQEIKRKNLGIYVISPDKKKYILKDYESIWRVEPASVTGFIFGFTSTVSPIGVKPIELVFKKPKEGNISPEPATEVSKFYLTIEYYDLDSPEAHTLKGYVFDRIN